MATKAAKETSLPVIIALVFFVIATVGLGVFCYVLMSDQEADKAAVDKAKADQKNAQTLAKDYELIARINRIYAGLDDGDDRKFVLDENVAEGSKGFQELKRLNDLTKEKVSASYKAAADKAGGGGAKADAAAEDFTVWPAELNGKSLAAPTRSLIDLVVRAQNARNLAVQKNDANEGRLTVAVKGLDASSEGYVKGTKTFTDAAAELPKKYAADVAALRKKIDDQTKKYEDDVAALRKDNDAMHAKGQDVDLQKRRLEETIARLKDDVKSLQVKLESNKPSDPFQYDAPIGKVTKRLPNNVVEIDLGSNDLVTAGLTFTVLPNDFPEKGRQSRMKSFRERDERGNYTATERFTPKSTVEVIEVLGPTLSRARITSEYDEVRDATLTGDLLYNAVWRRGQADHVALVGVFDTNGDGTDDIDAVVRDLRKMGIPVDAYFDLKTQKWSGKITERTRYLVDGYTPTNSANDPNRDAKTKLIGALAAARDEGRNRGVNVVNFRDFFGKMGYRVSPNVSEDRINQATARYLSGVGVDTAPTPPPAN